MTLYISSPTLQPSSLTTSCPELGKTTKQRRKFSTIRPHASVTTSHVPNAAHSLPPEKLEIFKSLEPWATQSVLPLLKPVEKCWQPSDFLPNSSDTLDQFATEVQTLRDQSANLPDDYLVVLVGNMVTEDAVPAYLTAFNTFEGVNDQTGASTTPWATWSRAWAAEENRHGDLLRTYLYLSGRVDMRMVEKTVQYLIRNGMDPGTERNPYMGFVYTSFQERATFFAHGNTARLAMENGDPLLARMCGIIAADEKRHEKAYSRIVQKLVEVDPTTTMLAISDMIRKRIKLPSFLMYDGEDTSLLSRYSAVSQRLGVYTTSDYADLLDYYVGLWRLEKLEGLTGEARRAQEFVCQLAPKIRKSQELIDDRARDYQGVKFGWLFNKEVMV